jgi:hypothetical protein
MAICGTPAAFCILMAVAYWSKPDYLKAILWSIGSLITMPLLPFALFHGHLDGNYDNDY